MKYNWQKIKSEYVEGNITLKELSVKYGCGFSTIQNKSAKEDWQKVRENYNRKVVDETQKKK